MEIEFILLIFLFATAFTVSPMCTEGFLSVSFLPGPDDRVVLPGRYRCSEVQWAISPNNLDDEQTHADNPHETSRERGTTVSSILQLTCVLSLALRPSSPSSCPSFPPQVPCIIWVRRAWRPDKKTVGVDYRNEGGSRQSRKVSVKTINVKPRA